ncbi:MAG: response regulator [Candidatus Aceula meridiana]|nr:response regulator [Candidatus Aceula meridiana]
MLEQEILNAKILIIDDQKLHLGLLKDILKKAGYANIESTTDPQEGIELYQDFKPDILLLDLIMPKIDGFSVMAQLKEVVKNEAMPILALSPEKGQDIRLKALEAGATDFISKPYEGLEVLVRIRNIIAGHLLHNQVKNQNKILEEKVQERTKELRTTRLDIIRRLARAAEFRDEDTGIHIVRMSKLCTKVGKEIGMDAQQCDLLLNASPLHDIGKLGIPDNVLLKPGKLTPEEWEIMKKHASIGAELLSGSNSDLMEMAEVIAMTHHEKWDGTGYPQGLKGEAIPLVGRITAICDVFDALMSKRPYKKAWTFKEVVDEIKATSGTHFDPKIVDAFLKILPDKEVLKKDYESEQ